MYRMVSRRTKAVLIASAVIIVLVIAISTARVEVTTHPKLSNEKGIVTIKNTPVKNTPVKVTPVKATPVKATPVKVTPVKATPVKATPVKVTPVKVVAAPPKSGIQSSGKQYGLVYETAPEYPPGMSAPTIASSRGSAAKYNFNHGVEFGDKDPWNLILRKDLQGSDVDLLAENCLQVASVGCTAFTPDGEFYFGPKDTLELVKSDKIGDSVGVYIIK